ncbi:MAG: desulfoferrodoxin family protein [Methylococcales bacterium]|nr:desulfoferrodoxin family protein [Methylococcales bacterium]MDD5755398.1 desulfoferrodoxin family protein [Methylococcales bacterium]
MKRRDFMRLGLVGAGLMTLNGTPLLAETNSPKLIGAGGLFYTKENAGRWAGKVATHLPTVEIEKSTVKVTTAHEMNGFEHYIVKHVLLDKNYQFLDEHFFNPTIDKTAVSTFTLSNYSGTLHVLSLCNKHDLWLNSVEL